jgi:2-polyprenyl-3-methyl-5-hydroxy-6-metoxy-1,4-benzoquinol methylase
VEDKMPERPDIGSLLETLRERVEERRKSGAYPPDLEEEMAAHFKRIAAHRPKDFFGATRESFSAVHSAMGFDSRRIPVDSRMPAGSVLHRLVRRIVGRQIQGAFDQLFDFAQAVYAAFNAMEESAKEAHFDLTRRIDAIIERLAAFERAPDDSVIGLRELRRRVEALEDSEASRRFRPWFSSARFEESFQLSSEDYAHNYDDLASRFVGLDPVLDIGCGSGRFLELLRDRGVEAYGVDTDAEQVKVALGKGLEAELGEGLDHLRSLEHASLGGVAAIQVVEHLTAQQLLELVFLLREKIRPGGLAIVETLNPVSLYIFAHTFYIDPTHRNPIHPNYLSFLFDEAGFQKVEVALRFPLPAKQVLQEETGTEPPDTVGENVRRLNELLFAPQHYAVIAER